MEILQHPSQYPHICVVEGFRACEMFAYSKIYKLCAWFLVKNIENSIPEYVSLSKATFINEHVMNYVSKMTTPPGIIGIFETKEYQRTFDGLTSSTFILDNICDPGNMGTIIRTAVALNRKSLVIINGCYHNGYKVVQASAGMMAHIKIIRTDWNTFMKHRSLDIPLYGLAMNGQNIIEISSEEMKECYWVIGNEAHGISKEGLELIDRPVSIPMSNFCESLNAGVAAAIAGYRSWHDI
jgi:TrmH family RNA methyltransferase